MKQYPEHSRRRGRTRERRHRQEIKGEKRHASLWRYKFALVANSPSHVQIVEGGKQRAEKDEKGLSDRKLITGALFSGLRGQLRVRS